MNSVQVVAMSCWNLLCLKFQRQSLDLVDEAKIGYITSCAATSASTHQTHSRTTTKYLNELDFCTHQLCLMIV